MHFVLDASRTWSRPCSFSALFLVWKEERKRGRREGKKERKKERTNFFSAFFLSPLSLSLSLSLARSANSPHTLLPCTPCLEIAPRLLMFGVQLRKRYQCFGTLPTPTSVVSTSRVQTFLFSSVFFLTFSIRALPPSPRPTLGSAPPDFTPSVLPNSEAP